MSSPFLSILFTGFFVMPIVSRFCRQWEGKGILLVLGAGNKKVPAYQFETNDFKVLKIRQVKMLPECLQGEVTFLFYCTRHLSRVLYIWFLSITSHLPNGIFLRL
jgi:hypothetical protein